MWLWKGQHVPCGLFPVRKGKGKEERGVSCYGTQQPQPDPEHAHGGGQLVSAGRVRIVQGGVGSFHRDGGTETQLSYLDKTSKWAEPTRQRPSAKHVRVKTKWAWCSSPESLPRASLNVLKVSWVLRLGRAEPTGLWWVRVEWGAWDQGAPGSVSSPTLILKLLSTKLMNRFVPLKLLFLFRKILVGGGML